MRTTGEEMDFPLPDRREGTVPLDPEEAWRDEIIRFQHEEIVRRYGRKSLERIPELKEKGLLEKVSREDVELIEEMFLTVVYPSLETRSHRDKSFASLVKLMKNPRKLSVMAPAIPKIMLRFSYRFPLALRVGLDSALAYVLSMNVESRMMKNLREELESAGRPFDRNFRLDMDLYRKIYARTPHKDFMKLIHLARRIALTSKTPDIMFAAREIMNDARESMRRMDEGAAARGKPLRYEEDVWAISFGLGMLEKIIRVFERIDAEKIGVLIELLTLVETEYLNGMHPEGEKAA